MTAHNAMPHASLLFALCLAAMAPLAARAAEEAPAKPQAQPAPAAQAVAPVEARLPAPAPAPASPEIEELKAKLADAEARLGTALRSYSLLEQQGDQEKQASLTAAQKELGQLRQAGINANLELAASRDQLRQTQAQLAAISEENADLRTKLALRAPYPDASRPAPSRQAAAPAPAPSPSPTIQLPPAATRPPAPPAAAPAPEPAVQEHVIAEGDTLSKISTKYYGTPTGWKRIFEANRNLLSDPGRLPTGASIKIP